MADSKMSEIESNKQMLELGLLFYRDLIKKNVNFIPKGFGEFNYSFIVKFPPNGSMITAIHTLPEFDFVIVAPIGFTNIHNKLSLSTLKILSELSRRELHINTYNPFDRDRLTFISDSGRFLLRKITHNESFIVINYLERYLKSLSGIAHSFVPKFLGIFSFRVPSKSNRFDHFILTCVVVPNGYKIHKQYELHHKESTGHFKSIVKSGLNEFKYNHPDGFLMNDSQRRKVSDILQHDIEVLRILRVLKYSLRVYVHNFNLYKREIDDETKNTKRRSSYAVRTPFHTVTSQNASNDLNLFKSKQNIRLDSKPQKLMDESFTSDSMSIKVVGIEREKLGKKDADDKGSYVSTKARKYHLFNTPLLQADFYKAKRYGAIFVYDIKGEHLAIFISFGHIYDKAESLINFKTIVKSTFANVCTNGITTTASYADNFEQFLFLQVFRPVKSDTIFEPWPDEMENEIAKDRDKKVVNPIDKWADIKAKLLSESTSDEVSLLSGHRMLSEGSSE